MRVSIHLARRTLPTTPDNCIQESSKKASDAVQSGNTHIIITTAKIMVTVTITASAAVVAAVII